MAKQIKSEEFDRIFDEGEEDITPYLDLSTARRPAVESKMVNVAFPQWMVDALDREAELLSISRQAVVKVWVADRIKSNQKMAA